jgi:hypothetical protein
MASTYSDLKIELIGTGEQTGTWGTTTNNNFSVAIGEAITGSADVAFSSADVTVTLTNTNAAQTARNLRLNLTGTSGGARNLILGSGCQIEKLYLINNGLADAVTVKNTSGTGIAVPPSTSMLVFNNGTNVVAAVTAFTDLTDSSLTAGRVTYAGTGGNLVDSANLTFNGTTLTAAALTSTGVATFSAGTVSAPAITTTGDTNTGIFFPAADTIAFTEGGAEVMRLDASAQVGIGTSSPSFKLDVVQNTNGTATVAAQNSNSGVNATARFLAVSDGGNAQIAACSSTYSDVTGAADSMMLNSNNMSNGIVFAIDGVIRAKIDSTGSVGIGTTSPSAMLQVAGSSSVSALKIPNIEEVATISATAATGTIAYDITTQSVLYYTTDASGNFTVNFRGSSGTSLNTLMATGESMSVTFLVTNGATAYYNSAVQVDGSSVTPKWQGGSAPTAGNASSIDSYTYVIIKTGSAAFTVLASITKFA